MGGWSPGQEAEWVSLWSGLSLALLCSLLCSESALPIDKVINIVISERRERELRTSVGETRKP